MSVTGDLLYLNHRHLWQYRGQLADGQVLLVCDEHDPPEARAVRPQPAPVAVALTRPIATNAIAGQPGQPWRGVRASDG